MKRWSLGLAVLFVSLGAYPQMHADSAPRLPLITLGQSAVALEHGWKFAPGDPPWVNGASLWAQPDFDDAHWAAMDLAPRTGSRDIVLGVGGFVPGWTARGYPRLSGYAWYRLRVRVADPGQELSLKMPPDYDDVFQLYADGRYIGELGHFDRGHVTEYFERPLAFVLPAPGPDGVLTLALRFYMSAGGLVISPDSGGMHGPPVLGEASTIALMQARDTGVLWRFGFSGLAASAIFLLIAPLALWAWLYSRRSPVWLWLLLYLLWRACSGVETMLSLVTMMVSIPAGLIIVSLTPPFLTMFWWHWFGLEEKRWIPVAAWLLGAGVTAAAVVAWSPTIGLNVVPVSTLGGWSLAAALLEAALSLLQLVILAYGFRRARLEALLAAPPLLLNVFAGVGAYALVAFHIPSEFFPFGLGVFPGDVISVITVTLIFALSLRRFMRTQVRESLARQEITLVLEQAQQLQQRVLVPEKVASPVFAVETEYLPAQTVGGDFFQTLTSPDGALLVVIGDVSGKGVSASMLVAVLVGAIRSQAEHSFEPAAMLATLNRRTAILPPAWPSPSPPRGRCGWPTPVTFPLF